jgi:type IV secretory pathway VirB4 component
VIIAPTGSGKTVTDGTLLMRWATTEDAPDLILIDPVKGDYRTMVEALGGQIVRMSADPKVVINPFEAQSQQSRHEGQSRAVRMGQISPEWPATTA